MGGGRSASLGRMLAVGGTLLLGTGNLLHSAWEYGQPQREAPLFGPINNTANPLTVL